MPSQSSCFPSSDQKAERRAPDKIRRVRIDRMFEGVGISIRVKTITILVVSFLALMVVFSLVLNFVVTPKFEALEIKEVHSNVDRFVKEIENNALELRSRAADWGAWDDTYQFMEGKNPGFVASNMSDQSIAALNVDIMLLIDNEGSVILKKGIDSFFAEEVEIPKATIDAVVATRIWETFGGLDTRQGLLMAGDTPLIFAAHRILRSDDTGPPVGILLVGRFINADFIKKVNVKLNASASVLPFDKLEMEERIENKNPITYHGVTVYSDPADRNFVSGFASISDWSGKPALVVQVRSNRDIYNRGVSAILQSVLALLLLGVVFMAVSVYIVDRIALSRLTKMTDLIAENPKELIRFDDQSGDEIGVLAATIEDSFKERAEHARVLATSERRMELALAGAELGFWEYDLSAGTVFFSDRFSSMLGYEPGELAPSLPALEGLIHPDDRKHALDSLNSVISQPNTLWDIEYRVLHRDGSYRNVHSRGRVVGFDGTGGPSLLSGTHMDVTERARAREQKEKLEERLRSAEKLKAVGTLAGGVAHNFNNILAAIMGYAELVQEDLEKGSQPYRNLSEILDASSRASELIRQLLVFSQDRESVTETLDVRRLVIETFKFMREVIPTSIEMVYRVPNVPLMVTCDSQAVRQALINICANAREALPTDRGRIVFTVTEQGDYREAWEGTGLHAALITIEDDGVGMSPEVSERAFEPYYTTKGDADRLGLGLSLAHGAVTNCGGSITIESEVGAGTKVSVVLPVAAWGETAKSPGHEVAAGGESILFVDDEGLLVDIARQHFAKMGYRITATTAPAEALELFLANPEGFDAVVTDFTMPGMTGVELSYRLREISPEVPIFLCSGYIDVVSDEIRAKAGIAEVFRKPLSFDEMLTGIRKRLDQVKTQRSAS